MISEHIKKDGKTGTVITQISDTKVRVRWDDGTATIEPIAEPIKNKEIKK
jgi:hypothetical protein